MAGIIGAVVIVLIAIAYFINSQPAIAPSNNNDNSAVTNTTSQTKATILEGTLKQSDDMEKGNLLLVMPDKKIYLNTTRDFSALVGKAVLAKIDGTVDNFILLDISEK